MYGPIPSTPAARLTAVRKSVMIRTSPNGKAGMTITLPPDLEQAVLARVRSGPYRSPDEVVAAALEPFMTPDFAPGELARLVAAGKQEIADGHFVSADEVVRQLRSWGQSRRQGE